MLPKRRARAGVPLRLVVMGQELEFDLGHVHGRGAFGLAGLAFDAEVHRLVEALAGQFVRGQPAGEDGAQQVGAPARAVLFFARDLEAGAHGAGRALAAHAGAVAHFHGAMETLLHAEIEMGGEGDDFVVGAVAQVGGHRPGVDEVAGIEDVVRVKDTLDLLVEMVEIGAEEALVDPTAGTAVAVFAGERAAVAVQQIDREVDDLRHFGDFGGVFGC